MCGIGGVLHTHTGEAADPEQLARMNAALAHRGPDGEGLWHEGPAGLCHRRLSVLDLGPSAAQPMVTPDGRYVLSYNGEVYNFAALREELAGLGWAFRSSGDTEVVLAALAHWGEEALQRFNGMYAMALYDRHERSLLLARDRLGVKPLFYTVRHGVFAFASELEALRAGGFTDGPLSMRALAEYFTYLYIPGPETIYPEVFKLPPGHLLRIQHGRIRRDCYWELPRETEPAWTLESAAERYRELLDDAIHLRRVSDVPLGAFLSGGLDSSSVVALLARQSDRPVKTFTIGFEDRQMDELRFARQAAEAFGTDHTEALLKPNAAELLPRIVRHFGEPFGDSSALPMWLVSQVARQHVTVALSGDGGDELFAGYTWMHRALHAGQYRRIPKLMRAAIGGGLKLFPGTPLWNRVRNFHGDAWLSPFDAFHRRLMCLAPEVRRVLLREDQVNTMEMPMISRHQAAWDRHPGSAGDRMLHVDGSIYLPDDILTKVDRMSMAHGLEARTPLLDYRLVEFASSVPLHLKYARGVSKRLVKESMKDILPPALLTQRKQGFSVPIHGWFRGALGALLHDTVFSPSSRSRDYLDLNVVQSLVDAHRSQRENHGHALWSILFFEHWLRARSGAAADLEHAPDL